MGQRIPASRAVAVTLMSTPSCTVRWQGSWAATCGETKMVMLELAERY
jgi:hypothetical protein